MSAVLQQVGVDRRDVAAGDQAQGRVAEATTSYSPDFISCTASSEVPKYFTLAWQPVSSSNGVTQSTDLSVEPSGVAGPRQDVDLALGVADRVLHRGCRAP